MEGFSRAWKSPDHSPMALKTYDDPLAASLQHADPNSELADADWPLCGSFEQTIPSTNCDFDLSGMNTANQVAASGAMTSITDSALSQSYPASSSNTYHTVAPHHTIAEPNVTWAATSDQLVPFGSLFFNNGPWGLEQVYPNPHDDPTSHEAVPIHLPQTPGPSLIHHNTDIDHMFSPSSLHDFDDHIGHDSEGRQRPEQRSAFANDPNWNGDGDDDYNCEVAAGDLCYAKLLYRCLKEAPDHMMTLQELYEWIARYTQKAKDPKNAGWKNSVRHNLSMNAAFERTQVQGPRKGCFWRLTDRALRDGVISTTRYRKDPKRKSNRAGAPSAKRQYSGARGGQATKAATRRNRDMQQARPTPPFQAIERKYLRNVDADFLSPRPMHLTHLSPHQNMVPLHASTYLRPLVHEFPMPQQPLPDLLSPPSLHLFYEQPNKPMTPNFTFPHLDYANGRLFKDDDNDMKPETPSLATEADFYTDDEMQGLELPYHNNAT